MKEDMKEAYGDMPEKERLSLLEKLKGECEHYLGEGKKHPSCLSCGTADRQLKTMRDILFSIPRDERPEWLTYHDIAMYDEKMDHRIPVSLEDFAGSDARFVLLFSNGKQEAGRRRTGEIFFSIKRRIYTEADGKRTFQYSTNMEYGYLTPTPGMMRIFGTLFQESPENRSIELIEWDDSWNAVFEDGIYISSRMCRLEKEDFEQWHQTIRPVGETVA